MSSLRLVTLMNAFDDEEEEKPQKLRGTVPRYLPGLGAREKPAGFCGMRRELC